MTTKQAKAQFTPGPWIMSGPHGHFPPTQVGFFDIREKSETVDGAVHADVFILSCTGDGLTRAEANARLIAAAPSLLAMLQNLVFAEDQKTISLGNLSAATRHWIAKAGGA